MSISDLLMEGVNLMLIGMGMVFLFLALLVIVMNGMSRLAAALARKSAHETAPAVAAAPKAADGEGEIVAVITAAISRFRSRHK